MKTIPIYPVPVTGDGMASMYEKQIKIYPRSVGGWFARWRWIMVWITQLFFYGVPWIQWNGRQAMLFDLSERRFYVLGLVLHPQDFIYLAALLILSALALFFFTAVAGRLWCGYACPQTVYTEIFMWVERHTEGDRIARMRLDASAWGFEKTLRKGTKQFVWAGIGVATGFSFVGYFTPIRTLAHELAIFSFSPWEWFWVLFYGFATYGNAGFMREQICKYMCPYARFQSALIDMDSLVIAYDSARGESRGSRPRSANPKTKGLGDCIDCTLCVQVCPTGIDIRDGLQNECIACAACIDVCDDVMGKMGYPSGLIRYSSGNAIANGWSAKQMVKGVWRPRVLIYGVSLLVLTSIFALSLTTRKGFTVDVMKDRGSLAREVGNGAVENVFRLHVMNRTEQSRTYKVSASGLPGLVLTSESDLTVGPTGIGSATVRLQLQSDSVRAHRGGAIPIKFTIATDSEETAEAVVEKSTFIVPR